MFPQPKKWPQYVACAIAVIFVFKNPTAAAHLANHLGGLVSQGADALSKFASALHLA
jgi:polysaccharide deacetylase 2 family uncharacterized protein YibQ